MSKDRSIATDALEVLGTVITDKEVGRDAIHLACLPAVCYDNYILPGADVGLTEDGQASTYAQKKIGIVDPFLRLPIRKGQKFLIVIYPRTITSLRHVWSHPDIPEDVVVDEIEIDLNSAEARFEKLAKEYLERDGWDEYSGDEYNRSASQILMAGMDDGYIIDGGRYEGRGYASDIPNEAWELFEQIVGRKAHRDKNREDVYFSCSC